MVDVERQNLLPGIDPFPACLWTKERIMHFAAWGHVTEPVFCYERWWNVWVTNAGETERVGTLRSAAIRFQFYENKGKVIVWQIKNHFVQWDSTKMSPGTGSIFHALLSRMKANVHISSQWLKMSKAELFLFCLFVLIFVFCFFFHRSVGCVFLSICRMKRLCTNVFLWTCITNISKQARSITVDGLKDHFLEHVLIGWSQLSSDTAVEINEKSGVYKTTPILFLRLSFPSRTWWACSTRNRKKRRDLKELNFLGCSSCVSNARYTKKHPIANK